MLGRLDPPPEGDGEYPPERCGVLSMVGDGRAPVRAGRLSVVEVDRFGATCKPLFLGVEDGLVVRVGTVPGRFVGTLNRPAGSREYIRGIRVEDPPEPMFPLESEGRCCTTVFEGRQYTIGE